MTDSISAILREDAVTLDVQARKKPDIIAELVGLLDAAGLLNDADAVVQSIVEREQVSSTAIGSGIAIPHCLTDQVGHTVLAFGRKKSGAKFDAVDRKPVKLFFLMVGPNGAHTEHLRLLSKLSRYLHNSDVKQRLLSAGSAAEVIKVFADRER
jgi:fructose-specific phosphotransferase system IIA component